jgi:hypothetical protein
MDLAERLDALASRNDEPLPVTLTDQEAKDTFLSALEEGKTIPEAASLTGKTASWFRRRRQPSSRNYDVDFANAFDEIMEPGGANRENLSLRAFTALVKAAEDGNVRAIEKILGAYHADFGWLRPAIVQGDVNIEKLMVVMRDVPTPLLEQVAEALEAKQKPELPFIDA